MNARNHDSSPLPPASPPPAILLGGDSNALSIARDLNKLGVKVLVICNDDVYVKHSRCCTEIPVCIDGTIEESWGRFLIGEESERFRGAVVLACSDAGIRTLAWNRQALRGKFLLADSNPTAQLAMLDKLTTYKHARDAGVPTPLFWEIGSRDQLVDLERDFVFPSMFKPRMSHVFEARFGRKHIVVQNFDELLSTYDRISDTGIDVLVMEQIPGPDDQLASYYTYLDKQSRPLFNFTKRIIRRFPAGLGGACYHITDWVPELPPLANQLFKSVGLQGLANIEFKRDARDGKWKVIECNARFTAGNCLVSASGCRISEFTYCRVAGLPLPPMNGFALGLRLWDPVRDFWAFRELRQDGKITLAQWIASLPRKSVQPFFRWSDPAPAMMRLMTPVRKKLRKLRAASGAARAE